ncbi:ASKHA domain-containing protein [Thermodesulfobacteriota bacterium]
MPDKEKHMVIFQPSGRRGTVDKGKTIKEASLELGVDIEGICGENATCGKCKIKIETGIFEKYGVESKMDSLSPVSEGDRKCLSPDQIEEGYRLACQTSVQSDVVIFVPEESRTGQQVIRKAARDIEIEIKPTVKTYTVELKKATLEDNTGDWERLQKELHEKFNVSPLTIDYNALLTLQDSVRKMDWQTTITVWMDREVIRVEPGLEEDSYGMAVDIGTTTVAAYLCDLNSGDVAATVSMMNPQTAFGEDVMSRITYCMKHQDGLAKMHQAIITCLNTLAGKSAARVGIKRSAIVDMTVVANTCMHHIFLNMNPIHIGRSPFPPAIHHSLDIKARDLGLKLSPGAYVHVLPIEAGFVGADNVGVLIAEEPHKQDSIELIIDIGTNGELILGNRQKLISASCATGPAFEGAEIKFGMRAAPGAIEKIEINKDTKEVRFKVLGREEWNTELNEPGAKGICGSAIIDVVPQFFLAGIIDKTGRFNKDLTHPRLRKNNGKFEYVIAWEKETSIRQDIVICLDDIRAIQLAKGAMYAGAKIMMRTLGVEKIDKVVLAGAFGSYIDPASASLLGLFPDCDPRNIASVGNAAGDGARMALLNRDKRKEADEFARKVEYIELTLAPDFDKVFAQAMWVPHMKDKFPSLEGLLP